MKRYFYTDNDSQMKQLVGKSSYTVTFPKGQLPPVKGFWSLTMYNPAHFFAPNPLNRAYWPNQPILDGTWKPPIIELVKRFANVPPRSSCPLKENR